MKIGIISDTHDNLPAVEEAVKVFNSAAVGLIIHAGDWNAPFSLAKLGAKAKISGIFGNVDGERLRTIRCRDEGTYAQTRYQENRRGTSNKSGRSVRNSYR